MNSIKGTKVKQKSQKKKKWWVLVNSISKISDGCIRDLEFNLHLHQKLIGILI